MISSLGGSPGLMVSASLMAKKLCYTFETRNPGDPSRLYDEARLGSIRVQSANSNR